MVSFQKMMEHMDVYREEVSDTSERKASEAIRTGLGIRKEFWEDFLLLLNNSAALSQLLKVPQTKVSSWRVRVQRYLNQIEAEDEVPNPKKRAKLIRAEKDPFDFDW